MSDKLPLQIHAPPGLVLRNCPQIQNKTKQKLYSNTQSFAFAIFLVHIDKVLAWLSFRKICILKASFSRNLLQITDINFLPTVSLEEYFPPSTAV